jgi:ubiquinone/menaquinone biosynthesis C-methylase UbiE
VVSVRQAIKRQVRRRVPAPLLFAARGAVTATTSRRARAAFERAGETPRWLDPSRLPELERRYPRVPAYDYDPDAYWRRGEERARTLGKYLSDTSPRTLEIGAGDGMVGFHLSRAGARATAVDISSGVFDFDGRARQAGVEFILADASELPLEDGTFDLVCSYNGFEHFADPQKVLREMIRVTRPGGCVYVWFGPLYFSAYGQHATAGFSLPFCHHLFERSVLDACVSERGAKHIPHDTLNRWAVQDFRDLWASHREYMEPDTYREYPEHRGTGLISEFPSCFRSKTNRFDDLIIASIEGAFTRIT